MKTLRPLILVAALCTTLLIQAQDVLDVIAKDACGCISDLGSKGLDREAYEMQLGLCMIKSASPHGKELKKKHKVDLAGLETGDGERLGELIGMRLVVVCPEFLAYLSEMELENSTGDTAMANVATFHGSVTSVRDRQFQMIQVKDGSGRTLEMIRLEHFPNADLLTGAKATDLSGIFHFEVRELYDPMAGSYRPHNILVGLDPE